MANEEEDRFYEPPPKRNLEQQIVTFLWNSETNEFMGRTANSWAKVIIFYSIFYFFLALFWTGLWTIFMKIAIVPSQPRHLLKESLIGTNPGLGFRPMPSADYADSALIWFQQSFRYKNWTDQISKFLEPYTKSNFKTLRSFETDYLVDCSFDSPQRPNKSCRFPIDKLRSCGQVPYDYHIGEPCIFLKLNKIFNWVPEFYNDTAYLPDNLPKHLRDSITEMARRNIKELNTVWVSCEGENAADKEHIGSIEMYPRQGFSGYYFPFSNTPLYQSPLVAVKFKNPARGVLINIECKAWARNIKHDRHDRRGSVHFELMVDY